MDWKYPKVSSHFSLRSVFYFLQILEGFVWRASSDVFWCLTSSACLWKQTFQEPLRVCSSLTCARKIDFCFPDTLPIVFNERRAGGGGVTLFLNVASWQCSEMVAYLWTLMKRKRWKRRRNNRQSPKLGGRRGTSKRPDNACYLTVYFCEGKQEMHCWSKQLFIWLCEPFIKSWRDFFCVLETTWYFTHACVTTATIMVLE